MDRSSTPTSRVLSFFVALAVVLAPIAVPTVRAQDALSEARAHYQKGNSLFASGDYKGAIAEFAEADNLSPSPMLEFNIALCYDRLGDRAEALRRYRVYLREVPSAKNRASVEAKILRLQGEIRQEQEAARQRREAEAAAAAAAKPAPQPAPAPTPTPQPEAVNPEDIVIPKPGDPKPAEVYTPSGPESDAGGDVGITMSGATYTSNDPDLARVAAIDVAAIRQQRSAVGAGAVGATTATGFDAEPLPPTAGPAEPGPAPAGANLGTPDTGKKASKPIYKQWWFWVVAGVGTLILIDFATSDSSDDGVNQRLMLPPQGTAGAPAPGGLEWRF